MDDPKESTLNQMYQAAFMNTADGMMVIDADQQITALNPAMGHVLGKPISELVGLSTFTAFEDYSALLNILSRSSKTDSTLTVNKRLYAPQIIPLSAGSRMLILRDVTERDGLESRRASLVQVMRHDLQNPFATLQGYLELLMMEPNLNDDIQLYTGRLQSTLTKLMLALNDLTDLAWIEAGLPIRMEAVDLDSVLHSALAEVQPRAEKKHIHFVLALQNPLPKVLGDPLRFQMIFTHVLLNSVLYSEEERVVAVHTWSKEDHVFCSIADQGFGIPDHEQEIVFNRMFRGSDPRVQAISGAGIGLTFVQRALMRMGGKITVSSKVDDGTSFVITLTAIQD